MNQTLYSQVLNILDNDINTLILVDMDGVLAEYKYGEMSLILNGDTDVYLKKRPICTVIEFVKKYYGKNKNHFIIITSCETEEQGEAKFKWISIHMPFVKRSNYIFVLPNDVCGRTENKICTICDLAQKVCYDRVILIEDTHHILKSCWECSGHKILPVHVINIIH